MVVEPGWTKQYEMERRGELLQYEGKCLWFKFKHLLARLYWVTTVMNMQYPHTFSHCKHPLNSSRGTPGSRSEIGVVGMHFKSPKGSRPEQENVVSAEHSKKCAKSHPQKKQRLIFVAILATKRTLLDQVSLKASVQFKPCFPKF